MKVPSQLIPRALTRSASAHLDLIRAVAAWAVMWGHIRGNLFVDFQHLTRPSLLLKTLYFVTAFGHQAVMVFFVLSGFLISSSVIQSCNSGTWSWRDYAINRSSRLYVVLIPGLLLGLMWDKLGSTIFASTGLYSHPLESFGSVIVQNQLTAGTFLGNLFFLQTILCATFGSNGPLWSLANEFWYYVLFPAAFFAGFGWARRSMRSAILLTGLTICLAVFLGWEKIIGFVIWLAGFGLVVAYSWSPLRSKGWLTPYVLVSFAVLAGCLAAARTETSKVFGSDLAVGIAFALFLFGVLHMDIGGRSDTYRKIAGFLADFSYSLYVLHFPLVLFLRAWVAPPEKWRPDATHLLYGALAGAAVLGLAWFVSVFTEGRTRAVRNWMGNAIPQRGARLS